MNTKFASQLILVMGLIFLFNNCGKGFKSLDFNSQSSQGLPTPTPTPTIPPTATPTPTAIPSTTPSVSPSPTPRPSPTPTPTCSCTPTPTPTIPPNPAGIPGVRPAPAWVGSLPVGQWKAISLNKIADVDSAIDFGYPRSGAPWSSVEGISGIVDDWSGGALASNYGVAGALLVFGGGHGGYGGSDVYGFDLNDRVWKRISNPSADLTPVATTPGTFKDGSPITPHTYNTSNYQPTTNTFVTLTAYISIPNPLHVNIAHHLNLNHLTADKYNPTMWRRSQVNTSQETYPGGALEGGSSCYDRNRDLFWIWEPPHSWNSATDSFYNRFTKYNPNITNSDGTVGQYTNYPGDGSGHGGSNGASCDPIKDIYVFGQFNGGDARNVYYRDLRNPSALAKKLSVTGGPPVSQGNGWDYSDTRDSFIYWSSDADVYEFRIATNTNRNFTIGSWAKISNASSIYPETNGNGTFNRFRVAKFNLNGSLVEVAVVVSHSGEPGENTSWGYVYAFRLP